MLQLSLTANVVGISATPTPPTLAGGILNDVEHEPGLVWPTVTMPTATPPSVLVPNFQLSIQENCMSDLFQVTGGGTADEAGLSFVTGRIMAHLQRITERMSSVESLQIQTLRKLEGIDYR